MTKLAPPSAALALALLVVGCGGKLEQDVKELAPGGAASGGAAGRSQGGSGGQPGGAGHGGWAGSPEGAGNADVAGAGGAAGATGGAAGAAGAAPKCIHEPTVTFPTGGVPNDNQFIGPFCCTGRTATVTRWDGIPVGYVYYFNFGDAYQLTKDFGITELDVLVSAVPHLWETGAQMERSSLPFLVENVAVGATSTTTVGALVYTATVEHVDISSEAGLPLILASTFVVRLDVQVVSGDDQAICPM